MKSRNGERRVQRIGNGHLVTKDGIIEDGLVVIIGGRIAYAGPRTQFPSGDREIPAATVEVDAAGGYISPGFIDIHVHGGGGADVMDGTPEALRTIAQSHVRHGTTAFLATTMTAPLAQLLPVVRTVRHAVESEREVDNTPRTGSRLLGLHLEGPYVNVERAGAQNPRHMRPPAMAELEQLYEAAGDTWRVITLAPELDGADEAIRWLVQKGVNVSMGHTAANYAEARRAIEAGATQLTHTFNAMNGLHHREPGLLGACLADERVFVELIADGLHVHPAMMGLLYRLKGPDRLVLITDAMRAQGCGDGRYTLGDLAVVVRDNEARLADDAGSLAGSLLTMDVAVRALVKEVGAPIHEAVKAASYNPASVLGLASRKGSLEEGKDADVVVFDGDLRVCHTVVAGEVVYSR